MDDIDIRAAATAARQLARQAWDLKSLHEVLDRLAGDDQELKAIPHRIAALQKQEGEQLKRLAEATEAADTAQARAEALSAEQTSVQEGRIAALRAEILSLETKRTELAASVQSLERENAQIRERLRAAVA